MVKILCVSDIVMPQMESAANLRRRYNDVDVIVSCGDLPPVYLEFIVSILNVPLLYVRGNHDEIYTRQPPGGDDLNGRIMKFKGLTFAGLEGSMRYSKGSIQYTEGEMLRKVIGMGPGIMVRRLFGQKIDVLVTHSPPRGIHDAEDLPHRGFKAMLNFLHVYQPRYMLHGHVHTYDRRKKTRTQFRNTCIININPVTVLEIEPD
ncbi:MAG: metallophosphoesterase family protein [Chloroflexota bacterium]